MRQIHKWLCENCFPEPQALLQKMVQLTAFSTLCSLDLSLVLEEYTNFLYNVLCSNLVSPVLSVSVLYVFINGSGMSVICILPSTERGVIRSDHTSPLQILRCDVKGRAIIVGH